MQTTAQQLSGNHIGKTVSVHQDGATTTGMLTAINYRADLVTDQRLCEPEPTLGISRTEYEIRIGYLTVNVNPDTPITIQEEQ